MIAVVNHMKLSRPIDQAVIDRMQSELVPQMRQVEGFHDAMCVKIGDEALVFIVMAADQAALDRVSAVANPWIGPNVRPYVDSVDRKVGSIVVRALDV
jgi:hypothetical protein